MSMKNITLLLSAFLLGGPVSAQSLTFDLNCEGFERSNFGGKSEKTRELNFSVSVDLDKKLWSVSWFKAPREIHRVSPEKLILEYDGDPKSSIDFWIDRVSGAYSWKQTLDVAGISKFQISEGNCEVAEFTPFPTTLF